MAAGNSNNPSAALPTQHCNPADTDRRLPASTPPQDRPDASTAPEGALPAAVEARNLRRLQVMMHLLLGTIQQDRSLSVEDAAQLVANTRNAVLRMFPGKEQAFQMLCRPRIQRAMRDRFSIQ